MKRFGAFCLACLFPIVFCGCAGHSFSSAYRRVAEIESRAFRMEPNSHEALHWTFDLTDAVMQLESEVARLNLFTLQTRRLLDRLIEEYGLISGYNKFEKLYRETYENDSARMKSHKWLPYRAVAEGYSLEEWDGDSKVMDPPS